MPVKSFGNSSNPQSIILGGLEKTKDQSFDSGNWRRYREDGMDVGKYSLLSPTNGNTIFIISQITERRINIVISRNDINIVISRNDI